MTIRSNSETKENCTFMVSTVTVSLKWDSKSKKGMLIKTIHLTILHHFSRVYRLKGSLLQEYPRFFYPSLLRHRPWRPTGLVSLKVRGKREQRKVILPTFSVTWRSRKENPPTGTLSYDWLLRIHYRTNPTLISKDHFMTKGLFSLPTTTGKGKKDGTDTYTTSLGGKFVSYF